MELDRKATSNELALIEKLIEISEIKVPNCWKKCLIVRPMDDGGMGSLKLFPTGVTVKNRTMGKPISELIFKDEDSIDIIATLNIDDMGNLYELDIWKTDYSSVKKLPNIFYST